VHQAGPSGTERTVPHRRADRTVGPDPTLVAGWIRGERQRRGFTVDQLAALSGVSGSLISDVEQARRLPTAPILDRIATGLGTSLARLLHEEQSADTVVLRRHQQDVARDEAGWERRVLSPVLPGVEFEFMRTAIGPGVDAGVFAPHGPGAREYLAVESGVLRLSLDGESVDLYTGDSASYSGECQHGFLNPGIEPCVYYLAMDIAYVHRDPVMMPSDPGRALSVEDFMRCLHLLRIRAGNPSLATLAKRTRLPKSTLHDGLHLKRTRLPSLDLVRRVVSAIGQGPADTGPWLRAWRQLAAQRLNEDAEPVSGSEPASPDSFEHLPPTLAEGATAASSRRAVTRRRSGGLPLPE
jgi:transcriptional regulator with XRE-family HTH domain